MNVTRFTSNTESTASKSAFLKPFKAYKKTLYSSKASCRFMLSFVAYFVFSISSFVTAQTVVEYGSYVTGGGSFGFSSTSDDAVNMFEDATGIYYVSIHDQAGLQTTPGVYQPNFGGGQDLIMVKVDHTGQVVWSTFLGGPGFEGDGEPFFRTDKAFLVEGDGLYVSVKSSDTGILPGFNYIGTPTANTTLFSKLNLSTGALEWGTAIYTYDDQEIDPRDIYVDNGKVYVIQNSPCFPSIVV